jgi:hypothetical protein
MRGRHRTRFRILLYDGTHALKTYKTSQTANKRRIC